MLEPSGMREAFRLISQAASHKRSIHIPSTLGRKLPLPPGQSGKAKGVFDTARNALTRILYGSKPISTNQPQAFKRAIHSGQPFRNQFSFPTRHALSNSPFHFPRPPVVQRGMTEVGLGTARKFSTARPIFQHLVQNVPVVGRSAYEMDLDFKKKARKIVSTRHTKEESTDIKKIKTKKYTMEDSFNKYFPVQSSNEEVSTVLTVPLTPFDAPIAPSSDYSEQNFLPFFETAKNFQVHGKHSRRISTLFRKLDEAKVWDRGAHYEAFGSASASFDRTPPSSALCTSLRIVFDGWTADMVRNVIGDSGMGWCMLEENKLCSSNTREGPFSLESSRAATPAPQNVWDQTPEFVMPSIDFSSSFLDSHSSNGYTPRFEDGSTGPSTPWSDCLSLPSTRPGSEFGDYESENEWHVSPSQTVQRNESGIAFSAEFMRRSQDMNIWSNF